MIYSIKHNIYSIWCDYNDVASVWFMLGVRLRPRTIMHNLHQLQQKLYQAMGIFVIIRENAMHVPLNTA